MRRRILFLAFIAFSGMVVSGWAQWGFSIPGSKTKERPMSAGVTSDALSHEFVFARMRYTNCFGSNFVFTGKGWRTDYPKADRQFLIGVKRILGIDAFSKNYSLEIGPELHRLPFLYVVEPGQMCLSVTEAVVLREYLMRGGFLMADDFWGTHEWNSFVMQMRHVFPDRQIRELPMNHPVFHQFFEIDELVQIPNVGQAMSSSAPTFEQDGYVHRVYGIHDDENRLMVLIFHNTDLGDAWEWAENPRFPLNMSNYAYAVAINAIVYSMSH